MSFKNTPCLTSGQYKAYLRNITVVDGGWNAKQELVEEWHITTGWVPDQQQGSPYISPLNHAFFIDPTNRAALEYAGIVPQLASSTGPTAYTYYNWRETWTSLGYTTIPGWDRLKLYNDAYSEFVLLSSEIQSAPGGDVIVRNRWSGYVKGIVSSGVNPNTTNIAAKKRVEQAIIEVSVGRREAVIWRRNWSTNPPDNLDITTTDIGGTAVRKYSLDGRPQDVTQTRIRVRIVKNAQKISKTSIVGVLQDLVGTRNSVTFMGYTPGQLWCDAFQLSQLDGPFYEIVFDFIYDEWFEHSQEPELDPDGKPSLDATGTNYADVRWVRMQRDSKDFNQIYFNTFSDLTNIPAGSTTVTPIIWTEQRTLAEVGWMAK